MPVDFISMLLPLVLKPIIEVAGNKIGEWYKGSKKHREAVEAITKAVKNTDEYLQELQKGQKRKRQRELGLSVDWDIAGIALGEVAETREEKNLADKLRRLKKDAWANYDKWSDEEIEEAGIDISTIREKLEKYIEISEQEVIPKPLKSHKKRSRK